MHLSSGQLMQVQKENKKLLVLPLIILPCFKDHIGIKSSFYILMRIAIASYMKIHCYIELSIL